MATVTLERTDGTGPVAPNARFTLQAKIEGGIATAWKWKRNSVVVPNEMGQQLERAASADSVGKYQAIATVDDALELPEVHHYGYRAHRDVAEVLLGGARRRGPR